MGTRKNARGNVVVVVLVGGIWGLTLGAFVSGHCASWAGRGGKDCMLLIGWPKAGSVWNSTGDGTQTRKARGWVKRWDIGGSGARGTGRNKARAVGAALHVGESWDAPAFEDKRKFKDWLRAQTGAGAATQAAILGDESGGRTLMTLGARAARRAALQLAKWYGVQASATSIEEGAADAVAKLVIVFGSAERVGAHLRWLLPSREVGRVASNAAWNSLRSWAGDGLTGDTSRLPVFKVPFEEGGERLELGAERLRAPAIRRAAVRRLYVQGVRRLVNGLRALGVSGAALAKRRTAALRRWRVLGWVLLGESLATAAARAGWSSPKRWAESCGQDVGPVPGIGGPVTTWDLWGFERPSFR